MKDDKRIRGSLAFHPLFIEVLKEILNALCEDCREKIVMRFREYLGDNTYLKEDFKNLSLKKDVKPRGHPDLIEFIKIFNEVTWIENRHLECYASLKERLRLLEY